MARSEIRRLMAMPAHWLVTMATDTTHIVDNRLQLFRLDNLKSTENSMRLLINGGFGKMSANDPGTLLAAANLATNYRDAGRLEEAALLFRRAFDASKEFPELQWVEPHLAECLRDLGQQDEAGDLMKTLIANAVCGMHSRVWLNSIASGTNQDRPPPGNKNSMH